MAMSNHDFNFAGGDRLRSICAAWFVSYCYSEHVDSKHNNWNVLKTKESRKSKYMNTRLFHRDWLTEVLAMTDKRLERNTMNLTGKQIKAMAKAALSKQW